jgi:hypothetical protein
MGRYIVSFYYPPPRGWKVEVEGIEILNSVGIDNDKVRHYRGFGEWEIICSKNHLLLLSMLDCYLIEETTDKP